MGKTAIIGHTGFVGSNLCRQASFDEAYNSSNIADIRGREFSLLVCSGVSALKWWANLHPDEDKARIDALMDHLSTVRARTVLVMSTVDVYPKISGVDEEFDCASLPNHAYGTHRLYVETRLREMFQDVRALRIGGVFGPGLKKNVIYDLMHNNGLEKIHPGNSFQYYNVQRLWNDWQRIESLAIPMVNLVTEPVVTRDIADRFFPGKQLGSEALPEVHYDIRTQHAAVFGGPSGYVCSRDEVLRDLGEFVAAP